MGLKVCKRCNCNTSVYRDKIRPKWDWKTILTSAAGTIKIKSDQNGIERTISLKYTLAMERDKIRPKWDWKKFDYLKVTPGMVMIKSDQNGIERL